MPFGIKSAQEVFQKKFDEVCENLEGCFRIVDDVIISGKSKQEHDQNLMAFLQRCREKNIRNAYSSQHKLVILVIFSRQRV